VTTLSFWLAETRDHLEGSTSGEANILGANYTPGAGTLSLRNALGNIGPGAWLSCGLNVFLVTAVSQLGKTADVIGGQRGSTDVACTAGSMVRVNPRFTDFQIAREINRHLATMSSPRVGLCQVSSTVIDYNGSVQGYDLPASDLIRVLEVRREQVGPSMNWPLVDTAMWDVMRTAPSGFASGTALILKEGWTGLDVQIVYAKAFTPIAYNPTADVSTTGVSVEMEDIPPLGAAIRLMSGREVSRNQTDAQGDTRRAQEVPQGAVLRSYQGLQMLWNERVGEESARLRARYPVSW